MRPTYNKIEQSYIDYLKSIGCVFYAPLKEDLKEYINNVNGTIIGSTGSYTDYGYQLNGGTQIEYVNDFIKTIKYPSKFTIIIDYKKISQSGNAFALNTRPGSSRADDNEIYLGCDSASPNIFSAGLTKNWTMYCTSYPNSGQANIQHIKTGCTYNGNGLLTRIQDGIVDSNYTKTILEQNFPDMSNNSIVIGGCKNFSGGRWNGIIGNVLLFNKVLTQEELNQIL